MIILLKYFIYTSIFYEIYAQNDERISRLERYIVDMKEKSDRNEAELRAEIKDLNYQVRKNQEKMDTMALLHDAELSTLRKSLWKETVKQRSLQFDPATNEIAFFAKLGQDKIHLGIEQTIVFDDEVTNIDSTNSPGAYNKHTGVFTTPVNGLYLFLTTVLSSYQSTSHFRFYLNHTPLTIMYVHGNASSGWDSASQTIILDLKRGDAVSVKNTENDTGVLGCGHTIFSGYLIREHEGDVIVG